MDDPRNRLELIALVRSGRTELEATLTQLRSAQLLEAGTVHGWSAKDLLAHISAWDRWLLRWLDLDAQGNPVDPPERIRSDEQLDRFNERARVASQECPLPEVVREFAASYGELLVRVESLGERDLFEAGRYPWLDGESLWQWVANNTYGHYEEHIGALRAFASAAG